MAKQLTTLAIEMKQLKDEWVAGKILETWYVPCKDPPK
jgi:hypothetical protein